jgi:predicted aspartyl protease
MLDGVVDSGATRLVLPGHVAKTLALRSGGRVRVRYENNRTALRDLVTGVWLKFQGREGVFDAMVEPKRKDALIGAIVLETLDFVVDCAMQKLIPRDPHHIFAEIE